MSLRVVDCPECDADVEVPEDAKLGTAIDCDDCGAELEVESLEPLELILAENEDEDDEDEDDD